MIKTMLLGAVAAATLAAAPAAAATYLFTYTSTGAAPFTAVGHLTTAATMNAAGTFDVTAISGNVDGDAITALTANPNKPNASGSADGLFTYDNTVSPAGATLLTNPGLLFTSATHEYNVFADSPTQYELYQATGGSYTENSIGLFTLTAVPEPAAWTLMIAGFGLVGAALRRRTTTVAA